MDRNLYSKIFSVHKGSRKVYINRALVLKLFFFVQKAGKNQAKNSNMNDLLTSDQSEQSCEENRFKYAKDPIYEINKYKQLTGATIILHQTQHCVVLLLGSRKLLKFQVEKLNVKLVVTISYNSARTTSFYLIMNRISCMGAGVAKTILQLRGPILMLIIDQILLAYLEHSRRVVCATSKIKGLVSENYIPFSQRTDIFSLLAVETHFQRHLEK